MRLVAFTALALSACSPEPETDEQLTTLPVPGGLDKPAPSSPSQPLSPIGSLAGEWRVAGIDGAPLDEPYGLALRANEDEIWWEPRCANFAFGYRIEGLRLETGAARPPVPVAPGAPPPPVCTIGIPPRLDEVSRALQLADSIGRTNSNGILIEGGGHSLTLYSQ